MTGDGSAPGGGSLLATLVDAMARIAGDEPDLAPFALGWATVELDRAERAFAEALGPLAHPIRTAPGDTSLGAHCRVMTLDLPGLPVVVLLEPSTEGYLAATLARHGEGPAAAWLRPVATGHRASALDRPAGSDGDGPFGPQVRLAGGPATGPHRLLVPAGPGTITP